MSLLSQRNFSVGKSCSSSTYSTGFRLRLEVFLQWLVLVLFVATTTAPVYAVGGFQELLPRSTASAPAYFSKSGLSCTIDSIWFDQWGYRPVRFNFLAKGAKANDREIEVTIYVAHSQRRDAELKVSKSFTLSGGETAINGTLLMPMVDEKDFWWDVKIDGDRDSMLSVDKTVRRSWGNATGMTDLNTVIPDLYGKKSDAFLPSRGGKADMIPYRLFKKAEGSWLTHSGVDAMLLREKDFLGKQPGEFLALRQWLMAGGTLWIEQVTNGKKGLAEIEELLGAEGWEFGIADDRGSKPIEGTSGWLYESLAQQTGDDKRAIRHLAENVFQGNLAAAASRLSEADSRGWYAMRSYGFGRVMAFPRTAQKVPAGLGPKERQVAVSKWKQRNWPTRHGLSSGGASRSFGNWLIPGVGTAPVTEFQFLITLFVLAIGPLNYWLLRRSQRLHLLVLTTPLAALAVTVGLFAYALLSDGFGVKTRAMSVTLLNQATGEAVSWSRVTQYAASAPEGGYVFPDDAAVYPLLPSWGVLGGQERAAREVIWRDGEQRLTRGWLPTRTAVQHLIVRSHASSKEIRFSADGEEASNRLGADIALLLVRNADGDWLHAEGVASDTAARLAVIKKTAAVVKMRLLVSENQPEFPVGAGDEAEDALERFDFISMTPSRRRRNRNRGEGNFSENLLSKAIARLAGLDGTEALDLPPQSYVAVSYESVETPLGLQTPEGERIEETGSFHITVGRW